MSSELQYRKIQYRGSSKDSNIGCAPGAVPGVVEADYVEGSSSNDSCTGAGHGGDAVINVHSSTAVPGESASSYRLAQERAERRRKRAARKRSSSGLPSNRYRRKGSNSNGLFGSIDSDTIVRLMLIGFFLFLLCTLAMYRILASGNNNVEMMRDPTDELPAEPHIGAGNLRSNGGDGNPYIAAQMRKKNKNGLMHRVNSATSWFAKLPFGGGSRFKAPPKPSPESMLSVGDKTKRYYDLRQSIDEMLPKNAERTKKRVRQELRKNTYGFMKPEELPYTVTNCPLYPPDGYPYAWPITDIVENWPPDDPKPRPKIYQGICVFDHETELEKAKIYREAEVPFVVRDDPEVLRTAERWNHPGYMLDLLSDTPHRTEYSPDNHFMYWMAENPNKKKRRWAQQQGHGGRPKWPTPPEGWKPPTKMLRMPYEEWVGHANTTDDKLGPDMPHWYYRLIGCGAQGRCDKDSSEYLFDEMPFFQPRDGGLYIVEPDRQKGIHCRFGMQGVIAENHFDGSRNSIAVLGGERRYILSHPEQCPNLALYPKDHPSARHSAVDWSKPDLETYPEFAYARANEVILQAGDVLYLPTNWFHFIVSLTLNFQCNTRSGLSSHYMQPMKDCGFF